MLIVICKVYIGQPILMTFNFIHETHFVATNEGHVVLECSLCKSIGEFCFRIQNKELKLSLVHFYQLDRHVEINCYLKSVTTLSHNMNSLFLIPP
jgi:hypothetical protein